MFVVGRVLGFNSLLNAAGDFWANVYSPRYNITEPVCVQFKYSSTAYNLIILTLFTLNNDSMWDYQEPLQLAAAVRDPGYWYTTEYSIVDGLQQIDFTVAGSSSDTGVVYNVFVDDKNVTAGVCSQNITTVETSGYLQFTKRIRVKYFNLKSVHPI